MPEGEPGRPGTRGHVRLHLQGEQTPASSTKRAADELWLLPASLPSGPIFKLESRSALSNSLFQNCLLKFTSCSLADSVSFLTGPPPVAQQRTTVLGHISETKRKRPARATLSGGGVTPSNLCVNGEQQQDQAGLWLQREDPIIIGYSSAFETNEGREKVHDAGLRTDISLDSGCHWYHIFKLS